LSEARVTDTGKTPDSGTPTTPSPAGIYDYWLGGTANSQADRDAAERIKQALPEISRIAWANRGFLTRVVRWMAERGIRQFIDIGAGLPTQKATHEVAGAIAGGCRVVYTDKDPVVVARGRRLLADVPGAAVIEADLREPDVLLGHPETARLIDLSQPVGLLIVAVTQFVPDEDDPWGMVARHIAPLAPGSFLALSAPTGDHKVESTVSRVVEQYADTSAGGNWPRTKDEIERFFTGLEFGIPYQGAEPGLTYVGLWGCDDPVTADDDASRWFYAGVARKPGEMRF
jgi:S-adenosyl methyltransferase